MDPLVRERSSHQSKIAAMLTAVNKFDTDPFDLNEAGLFLKKLHIMDERIEKIQILMVEKCADEAEVQVQEDLSEKINNRVREVRMKLNVIKVNLTPVITVPPPVSPVKRPPEAKLPRLQLPSFSGSYQDWQSFSELFKTTIHDHASLTGAQKLQYLKTTVTGDAASLIKTFPVTNSSYSEAWKVLKDRYENEREIVHSLLTRLHKQPSMSSESYEQLQTLLDTTSECVNSLKVLSRPVDTWDDMLVYLVVDKMDSESRREWALSLTGTCVPTFKQLSEFITQHVRGLQAAASTSKSQQTKSSNPGSSGGSRKLTATHHSSAHQKCVICVESHYILHCSTFKKMSVPERYKAVRAKALCNNCLNPGHGPKDCPKPNQCRTCSGRHHTFIHRESQTHTSAASPAQNATVTTCITGDDTTQVLLSTALVKVNGQVIRVFLDSGSQASFITESCVKSLGLKRQKTNVIISGVASTNIGSARAQVTVSLTSCVYPASVEVEALVLPKVTGNLPRFPCQQKAWTHLKGLQLADPTYSKPGPIDMLLGADVMASIMRDGRRSGVRHTPIAQNSLFGWVLSGRVPSTCDSVIETHHVTFDTDSILRKFWEIEELPPQRHLTAEEKLCETHFTKTFARDLDGRFVLQFPLKTSLEALGSSRERAISRLKQVERRLGKNPDFRKQYNEFMNEYLQLNHMEAVPLNEVPVPASYYLPHHFVLKEDSTTTKFRVVFDGSCKSTSGVSLNQCLMVGPTIQENMFSLLLRFRCHEIALKADISKMYRQFKVTRKTADFQRIVWRDSPDQPIQDFRLTTVTYGTAAAPYLATKCLQQLADCEKERFPLASAVLKTDFYVDDLVGGESTPERALHLQRELCELVKCGGMDLRKWSCSDRTVLEAIPPELRENQENLSLDTDSGVKALGVQWNPSTDSFVFKVIVPATQSPVTKRILLSELAKVFDPLGWLSPTTIRAKIIFQELWKQTLSWDEELSQPIQQQWHQYQSELPSLRKLLIPRCIISPNTVSQQLLGFCDASQTAYAAVVYLRSERSDGSVLVRIITAKTKVAPIRQVCVPRLELCGAVLLANLMKTVRVSTKLNCDVLLWSDSTIVLKWLASFPGRWKTFVANRVAEIQELYPVENWRHVRTEDNPADCASRGIFASELVNYSLWWNGPDWLLNRDLPFFPHSPDMDNVKAEERKSVELIHQATVEKPLIHDFSSLQRLKQFTAHSLRFIHNVRRKKEERVTGEITPSEYDDALLRLIQLAQHSEFSREIHQLTLNKELPSKSKLLQLNPFLDLRGILRVGGRLQKAHISEQQKHQIILPNQHHITKLIIDHTHQSNLHAGFQLLWSTLQRKYWVLRARDTIRHQVRKCVVCRKHRAETAQQLMGSLPTARVNPSRPFLNSGLDYAGPFSLRIIKGRSNKTFKCYFCIFVCMATKAVHLEGVSDMTTEGFLAALKRFFARRGVSRHLYSDCGSNFVGAEKELKKMLQCSQWNSAVSHQLAKDGVTWHFNSPSAPHHGGLWEAGVKSTKHHLKRVIGNALLTFEEFQTVLCQVESCLNSRPLCALSSDPADFDALTPGHFLIGMPLNAIPEGDLTTLKVNRLSRWQHSQQLVQHFWKRWSAEYLNSLQQRFKWTTRRDNLQVGDLVIIKEDHMPPNQWKLGRITNTHPGADLIVRVVTVKTQDGEFKRPIVKLCPVLLNDE